MQDEPFDPRGLLKPGEDFPEQSITAFLRPKDVKSYDFDDWLCLSVFLWEHGYRWVTIRDNSDYFGEPSPFSYARNRQILVEMQRPNVAEARRRKDKLPVMLKLIDTLNTRELNIWQTLQQLDIPFPDLLDIFRLSEDRSIIVMQLWSYVWNKQYGTDKYLDSTVEIVMELAKQMLEIIVKLHQNAICHCDIHSSNILRDPHTAPDQYRFALVDFGEARIFRGIPLSEHMIVGRRAVLKAPEMSKKTPYDPYRLDVYQFGRTIRAELRELHVDESIRDWITQMVEPDPTKRLSASAALDQLYCIRKKLQLPDLSPPNDS